MTGSLRTHYILVSAKSGVPAATRLASLSNRRVTLTPYPSTESSDMSDIHTPSEPNMTIGGLAKAADVNVETIRFYQR